MGRNHPLGIIFAAILFGVLYQGGDWISFEMPNITREMILVIQGLVILFAGALEYMFVHRFGKSEIDVTSSRTWPSYRVRWHSSEWLSEYPKSW